MLNQTLQQSAQQLHQLLQQRQLRALLQPIVDLHQQQLLGHEALIRGPQGHPLEYPDRLFSVAQQTTQLSDLELLCRETAIRRFHQLRPQGKLFINVNPNVLRDRHHPYGNTLALIRQLGIAPESIVIELSERYPIDDPNLLKQALLHYRELGFNIAIDDLGAGYAGLKMWSEVKPDYVKIDRYFITDIDSDPIKQEFIHSILLLAQNISAKVIAEGIETVAELRKLQQLGIRYYQGYLLGKPQVQPAAIIQQEWLLATPQHCDQSQATIAELVKDTFVAHPTTPALSVLEWFLADKSLRCIPVVDEQIPRGLVRREAVMEIFAASFGRALHAHKSVVHLMDKQPLTIDGHMALEIASGLITAETEVDVFRNIIVTAQGKYLGVVSVRDILKAITQRRLQQTRKAIMGADGSAPSYQRISHQ